MAKKVPHICTHRHVRTYVAMYIQIFHFEEKCDEQGMYVQYMEKGKKQQDVHWNRVVLTFRDSSMKSFIEIL